MDSVIIQLNVCHIWAKLHSRTIYPPRPGLEIWVCMCLYVCLSWECVCTVCIQNQAYRVQWPSSFGSQRSNWTDNGKHPSAHVRKRAQKRAGTYRWTSVHMAVIKNVCTLTHPSTHTHRLFSRIFWIQCIISSICWVAALVSEPAELPVVAYE